MVAFKQDRTAVMKGGKLAHITVKKLDISDIHKMSGIFVNIHNENFSGKVKEEYFLNIFLNAQYESYILVKEAEAEETDYEIKGYAIFYDTVDGVDLFEIAVEKKSQKRGMGKKLLNESIERLFDGERYFQRSPECKKVLLEVEENNKAAIRLYENSGFRKISLRRDYYGKNKHCIVMEKYMIL